MDAAPQVAMHMRAVFRVNTMAMILVFNFVNCFVAAMQATAPNYQALSHNAGREDLNETYPRYRISPLDGTIIALPTQAQLDFQDREMGMLIHFTIATYIDIDGCNGVPGLIPDPKLFDPTILNTDQWMDSIKSSGARYATLVAKHNCGFTTWPSAITFETRDNTTSPYNYTVADSSVNRTNVVKMFSDSAEKYGVGHGFYYSTVVNNFLNVQNSLVNSTWSPGEIQITNETYDDIVIAQLTELWTQYGTLTEASEKTPCEAQGLLSLTQKLALVRWGLQCRPDAKDRKPPPRVPTASLCLQLL